MERALVADAGFGSAVAGIRSLGRAGVEVVAVGPDRLAAGLWSHYAHNHALAPAPDADPEGFAESVSGLGRRYGPLVAYCGAEPAVDALARHADALGPGVRLPFPAGAPLQRIRDKVALAALAKEAGMAMPATLAEGKASEITGAPVPCVVKPRDPSLRGALTTAAVVEDADALRALLSGLGNEEVVVQERARPPMLSLALVVGRDGAVVDRFAERVLETWPVAAGRVSRSVSVTPDEALVDRVAALLHAAGYWGMVQVDLMGGALLDVNPRLYGCLPNALRCGVELPVRWHEVACDLAPRPRRTSYPAGVTYRWLEADVSAAAMERRWQRLLRRAGPPRSGAMWAADDPAPSALLALRAAWVRAARRLPG
jgi:predicted ATP-grasp superfamily ATP-dependent carboligase